MSKKIIGAVMLFALTLLMQTAMVAAQYGPGGYGGYGGLGGYGNGYGGYNRAGPYNDLSFGVGYGNYPYTGPVVPRIDPRVRVGGFFGTNSYYATGLRAGIPSQPFIGYNTRSQLSSAYYPRTAFAGNYGNRFYWNSYNTRVGGAFGYTSNFRGIPSYGPVFTGGTRLGRGTATSFI